MHFWTSRAFGGMQSIQAVHVQASTISKYNFKGTISTHNFNINTLYTVCSLLEIYGIGNVFYPFFVFIPNSFHEIYGFGQDSELYTILIFYTILNLDYSTRYIIDASCFLSITDET